MASARCRANCATQAVEHLVGLASPEMLSLPGWTHHSPFCRRAEPGDSAMANAASWSCLGQCGHRGIGPRDSRLTLRTCLASSYCRAAESVRLDVSSGSGLRELGRKRA